MKIIKTAIFSLAVLTIAVPDAMAQAPFIVRDVKFEGLQRIPQATALNAVKVPKGKMLREADSTAVIRDLYKTGFSIMCLSIVRVTL